MNDSKQRGRRTFIAALGATMAGIALPSWAKYQPDQFRIGYQKAASTLVLLKAHGALEKRLAPLGVKVSWNEFPAGPQLLEGLNVGAIDFGYVGEAPPVFAQAAGADFVYTAYEVPTPHAEGVVVVQDSPITRGKRSRSTRDRTSTGLSLRCCARTVSTFRIFSLCTWRRPTRAPRWNSMPLTPGPSGIRFLQQWRDKATHGLLQTRKVWPAITSSS